ncbi:MAG: NADH-quinone oxidoreductase subunit NuoK [Sandaracinaceae bacterium]|nr:NADH-quinone oxidoreductase subunit NuoK [Sandaracinaceae bacterium]
MQIGLGTYLALASVLFTIGAIGFLTRRNVLLQLMSIEIMLNSVNLTLVAFNRWSPGAPGEWMLQGQVLAFFVIAVAAAEAAVGLAIIISLFRLKNTVESDRADLLRH